MPTPHSVKPPPNPAYDPAAIRHLFNEMARTYGFTNLVASFGFAALWRRQTINHLPRVQALSVVDLMSGMGELSQSLSRRIPAAATVISVDISEEMTRRARKDFPFTTKICLQDVLTWNPPPQSADIIVSSFGLKTFNTDQQAQLATSVARLLRPGGAFSFVEISVPPSNPLRAFFMFYLKYIIPLIGNLFLGNPANYRMLGIYTEAFNNCSHFHQCLKNEGLIVTPLQFFWGCATGLTGTKPDK